MDEKTEKIPFKVSAFLGFAFSFISLFVCYLVYSLLPESDFANSIERSGMDAVYAMIAAPAAAFIGLVAFILCVAKNRKYFNDLSLADRKIGKFTLSVTAAEWISAIVSIVLAIMLVLSFAFSLKLLLQGFDMKFLSPTNDTYFESLEHFILANCIVHFAFLALTVIKMCGVHLLDSIAKVFTGKKSKNS